MTTEAQAAHSRSNNRTSIEVAGTDLVFRAVEVQSWLGLSEQFPGCR